jgi:predicted kinase
MTATIYQLLVQRALLVLSQGHSVVVDAVFAREDERAAIHGIARKLNIRFVGLFLQTDLATRVSRVDRRERDASDATAEIAGQQEQYNIGAIDWDIIDASGTPEQTQERCQARIAREAV